MADVKTPYQIYLASDDWKGIRRRILDRDGHKCVVCGSAENLCVHHLTYRNKFHEQLRDLVTLCDKCHTAYHSIQNMTTVVDDIYRELDEEPITRRRAEIERQKELGMLIAQEIKEEYLEQDWCKGGERNMCDMTLLKAIVDGKCKKYGAEYAPVKDIQDFFRYRRCELFLRCMDLGLTIYQMNDKTHFTMDWLRKWYDRDKCVSELNKEAEIIRLKGEQR